MSKAQTPACAPLPLFLTPRHHHQQPTEQNTVYLLHKWGVKYVVTENVIHHDRPRQREWMEAKQRAERGEVSWDSVPHFDENAYLNGAVSRVFNAGRFDVFRVN